MSQRVYAFAAQAIRASEGSYTLRFVSQGIFHGISEYSITA